MPSLFGAGGQRSMLNLAHGLSMPAAPSIWYWLRRRAFSGRRRSAVRVTDLKASRVLTSFAGSGALSAARATVPCCRSFAYVNIVGPMGLAPGARSTLLFVNEQNTVSFEAGNASSWRGRLTPAADQLFYPWANGIVVVSHGVRDDMAQLTRSLANASRSLQPLHRER